MMPHLPYPAATLPPTPAFFTGKDVKQLPRGTTVLIAPFTVSYADIAPQIWQEESGMWFRMPDGYIFTPSPKGPIYGPAPTELGGALQGIAIGGSLGIPGPPFSPAVRSQLLATLRTWNASYVIVGPMPYRSRAVTFFYSLFGTPPRQVGGVESWSVPRT